MEVGSFYLPPTSLLAPTGSSMAVYAANDPIEDRILFSNSSKDVVAAVMDGHGGAEVSEFLRQRMAETLRSSLASWTGDSDHSALKLASKHCFLQLDASWTEFAGKAFKEGLGHLNRVGSCGLAVVLRMVDEQGNSGSKLSILCANAGDCRAVLGRCSLATDEGQEIPKRRPLGPQEEFEYEAIPLSRDHNAREIYEQKRIQKEHPNEPFSELIQCYRAGCCYVKGRLQPTRTFGDLFLKDEAFNGPNPSRSSSVNRHNTRRKVTPGAWVDRVGDIPYVTAEPEVTVTSIVTGNPYRKGNSMDQDNSSGNAQRNFVILATDGLWDQMSSEEAVHLVAMAERERAALVRARGDVPRRQPSGGWRARLGFGFFRRPSTGSGDNVLRADDGGVADGSGLPCAAQILLDEALHRAASERGLTITELKRIRPGRSRRGIHDDISVLVLFLK